MRPVLQQVCRDRDADLEIPMESPADNPSLIFEKEMKEER
jgi:hypothetical protein